MEQENLTTSLMGEDGLAKWAIYMPSISSFYTTWIGKNMHGLINPARVPITLENGVEGMDWMKPDTAYWSYKYNLYSAGYANLDPNKSSMNDEMVNLRDRNNGFVLGDSGGYQIGKGVWKADWKDINCPLASVMRKNVLTWLDTYMDYGMILDIPAWIRHSERGRTNSGITTFEQAIQATKINNDYFMQNRTGACKFLNVMQGSNHTESDLWYEHTKKYCDPKQYAQPFEGWAYGSQQMCDPHLALRRLVISRFDGLLEPGIHDWLHILGNSNPEWMLLLSDVQRSVRKHHNSKFTVSYDAASPFLSVIHGMIYNNPFSRPSGSSRWTFQNGKAVDDRQYYMETRLYKDVAEQDGHFDYFEDSPITKRLAMKDVCYYAPGQTNKNGKLSCSSWDTFAYFLLMNHCTWSHIKLTQEINQAYDNGQVPSVMMTAGEGKNRLFFRHLYCRDLIDAIFATDDRDKALALVDEYSRYWMSFRGSRGNAGKRSKNSTTTFNDLYSEV